MSITEVMGTGGALDMPKTRYRSGAPNGYSSSIRGLKGFRALCPCILCSVRRFVVRNWERLLVHLLSGLVLALLLAAASHFFGMAYARMDARPAPTESHSLLDRHLKTGHMSTGQNRPTGSGASRRVGDYRMRSSDGKLRWVVRGTGREKS